MGNPKNPSVNQIGYETVIGKNLFVVGDISSTSSGRIDGVVEGLVKFGKLLLGEGGKIKGDVTADSFTVSGNVIGNIKCTHVHITKTGNVLGDITVQDFSAEQGALISGKIITEKTAELVYVEREESMELPPPVNIGIAENNRRNKR